uniref:Uncharacterized protein n=1 Tax=Lactuca sativa TaxID=4236 RepID=A0A9R1UUT2_LACSA|nr:hypothetical protein LSAT_V11C800425910 [Lactuca sativa]
MQTDLEEAKGHEILKLQNSLQSIHAIVHETYALLTKDKERESAQKAVEEASAIVQETTPIHVEDTEKIDKLSAEVEKLKVMLVTKESESAQKKIYNLSAEVEELKSLLESERNRANGYEKKCTEALETIEIKQQKLEESYSDRVLVLVRHEEKLSDLIAKYPLVRFKHELIAYVERIYWWVCYNLKEEISPLLELCIQVLHFIYCYYYCFYFI